MRSDSIVHWARLVLSLGAILGGIAAWGFTNLQSKSEAEKDKAYLQVQIDSIKDTVANTDSKIDMLLYDRGLKWQKNHK